MTYIEFIRFIVDFVFIQVVESTFMVVLIMLLSGIKLEKFKAVLSVFICSVASMVLMPLGNNDISMRIIYFILLGVTISSINEISLINVSRIYMNVFIAIIISVIIEFICFIPLLFIIGENVALIQNNVFLVVVCSIPTRIFQYIILHLLYIKLGGKYEEDNSENQGNFKSNK